MSDTEEYGNDRFKMHRNRSIWKKKRKDGTQRKKICTSHTGRRSNSRDSVIPDSPLTSWQILFAFSAQLVVDVSMLFSFLRGDICEKAATKKDRATREWNDEHVHADATGTIEIYWRKKQNPKKCNNYYLFLTKFKIWILLTIQTWVFSSI